MEDIVEKREKNALKFVKKHWIIILIILLAFSINFYYFLLTKNQPLWWDEAVYGVNANHLVYGAPAELVGSPGRSILEVFMWVPLMILGFGEIFFRT